MLTRPKPRETDEDLLKQQDEFLKSSKGQLSKKSAPLLGEEIVKTIPQTVGIIGDVVEKSDPVLARASEPSNTNGGFPTVFQVDCSSSEPRMKKKKSLFALKLEEKCKAVKDVEKEKLVCENILLSDVQIHAENLKKLESMTQEEIIEEKKTLESTLSPDLLGFLKNRGAKRAVRTEPFPLVTEPKTDLSDIVENVRKTVDNEWLEMDKIEPEKLQWIGDIPDAAVLEPGHPYSARFDFSGDLQPFHSTIDVRTSLHHHGDEPERPGYTIQELYQLSRSTVIQQRIVALNTLGHIIRKTKMGYYDSCFDGALLKKLVESDVFFLLRFAMDDRTVTAASVNCLHEFFVCRSDEICLDRLCNVPGEESEPFLFVPIEIDKDVDVDELKDEQIIAQDVVRGVLRTDLLIRFGYILSVFDPDPITVSKIFAVAIRICRHSPEACQKVFDASNFMSFVFNHLISSQPSPEGVKLLRVLASSSQNIAQSITAQLNFDAVLKIIDTDKPLFKLKLECLALWKSLIYHGLTIEQFQGFTPCFTRLLWFYVAKVDVRHGKFDFELFGGIVSVINAVLSLKCPVEPSYDAVLQVCLQKWLRQLTTTDSRCNFSVAKAIGCAFYFLHLKYKYQGVQNSDVDFLKKLSPVLESFLASRRFSDMSKDLITFSHIIHCDIVDRDPENLPSLCSVSRNGEKYLEIVQDNSPLPVIHALAEFVLLTSKISSSFDHLPQMLMDSLDAYSQKVLNSSETPSWFSRYEVMILISLLKIKSKCCHPKTLNFGFKLVSFLRVDDPRVLEIIDILCSLNAFGDAAEIFKIDVMKDLRKNFFHSCENFPRHWMYVPIVAYPTETLKCLSYILEHCPDLIANVPPTLRYCHLCIVLLNGENIFDHEIHNNLERCFDDVLSSFHELDLNTVSVSEKSFYELYRDLVTEYASSSYGDLLFAKVVTLPLAQRFDLSFRKLMWSEFMHALRVINLPKGLPGFVPLDVFTSPVETDESLLVLYLNAVTKNVLTETRNGFIYLVAVENIRKYLTLTHKDENLAGFLRKKISEIRDDSLKNRLLC